MPPISNISVLTQPQQQYVIAHSKGMQNYGWLSVTIGWYSDGSKNMIVTMANGSIESMNIPLI
jgi:hypothetical protein